MATATIKTKRPRRKAPKPYPIPRPRVRITNPKAVAVARDVIAHLNVLRLREGCYVSSPVLPATVARRLVTPTDDGGRFTPAGDLQPHVDEATRRCDVCLLGACLLSKARVLDVVPLEDVLVGTTGAAYFSASPRTTYGSLADVFSHEQMGLMECAFERSECFARGDTPREQTYGAVLFGCRHRNLRDRVHAVMSNVVRNGGTFVVADATEAEVEAGRKAGILI